MSGKAQVSATSYCFGPKHHAVLLSLLIQTCRSGLQSSFWHDTNKENNDIMIWKDPLLNLDYQNFWSQDRLFKSYIVPPASDTAIRNHEICLASCSVRIERERSPDRAREIMALLHDVLNDMRGQKVYKNSFKKILHCDFETCSLTDFLNAQ
jgi:hypothetical protein